MLREYPDHVSSDGASTIEALITDTTLIINSAKCLFCGKILGYQGRFASDIKYHYSCLEKQKCIFCGRSGMIALCLNKACTNCFHLFCLQKYSLKSNLTELKCGLHTDKKKEKSQNCLNSFRKIANTIQGEELKLNEYRYLKGEIKSTYFSHGDIFWALINIQYFPKTAKLHQFPLFSLKLKTPSKKSSPKSWVSSSLKSISKDLTVLTRSNKKLLTEYLPRKSSKPNPQKTATEKDLLGLELYSAHHKSFHKDFLPFLESRTVQVPADCDSESCAICLEEDYEEDDPLISCIKCGVIVHTQCYGVPAETQHWQCLTCSESSPHTQVCVFCPVAGGVLKPSLNQASSSLSTHNSLPVGSRIWVHVFCAMHIDPGCIKDKVKIEGIDVMAVDRKRFMEKCEVCGSCRGACIKCASQKCKRFFHPGCAKKQFLCTRNKTGYDDVGCYCDLHKPSKLRRNLEIKEKKVYSDVVSFSKMYEKIDKKGVDRSIDTDFSYKEKYKIFQFVDDYIESKCGSFEVSVKWNGVNKALRGCVEDTRNYYTMLDPSQFFVDNIHTKLHKKNECQEYYTKNIMDIMKKELKILKLPLVTYKEVNNSS